MNLSTSNRSASVITYLPLLLATADDEDEDDDELLTPDAELLSL
jgi:hypothetical protein